MTVERIVADANPGNWVDRFVPGRIKYLFRLARFDRPVGTWLLLWPCYWGVALAAPPMTFSDSWLFLWFFLGAFLMRSAGCTWNDIVDRQIDALVERTAERPLARGHLTLAEAYLFLALLLLLALWVLLHLHPFAVLVALSSLAFVAAYPFMKRVTYWPQVVLGLAFNWGVLVGWSAVTGGLSTGPLPLYAAGIFWTVGYDTIYAHQDKEDDILAGVKSSALILGENTQAWLFVFYALAAGFLVLTGIENSLSIFYYLIVALVTVHFLWQVNNVRIDDSDNCLRVFRSNIFVGGVVLLGLFLGKWF
ncbi:MAG TPA: 4-hydroxybenzoate octaprenyltransferase [Sphingomonadales bacterium]|nr:4-hydroxybenzoate octaprenyltransferase [Sphingomonadales bacterium]